MLPASTTLDIRDSQNKTKMESVNMFAMVTRRGLSRGMKEG